MKLRAVLLAAWVGVSLLLWGCGDDDGTGPGNGSPSPLVFMREDSSVVQFPESAVTYVWCGDWMPGEVAVPAVHVLVASLTPNTPRWWLRAVVSDIELDVSLSFPNHFIWDQPDSAHIFLYDPPNELATDTEESAGTITFHQLPCAGGRLVEFTLDAVIGSEFGDMPAVAARGRIKHRVTGPPPWKEWPPGKSESGR